jgi:hypothetical protein
MGNDVLCLDVDPAKIKILEVHWKGQPGNL